MLIRVVARILERNEEQLLQGIEPEQSFIWGIKYIRHDNIDFYESLEKTKTLIYLYEGSILIVKEHVDTFHERLQELIEKEADKADEEEDNITLTLIDDKDDDSEEDV